MNGFLDVTVMRGGSSKGVFVRESDLPPPGPARDTFILRLMGSPDPMQLDGLGGTHSSTSKVVAMARGAAGCDARYLFAQVGVERAIVDYAGNCGNLTAAAALYAVQAGWAQGDGMTLLNENTRKTVRAAFDHMSAQPGGACDLRLTFLDPGGAVTGRLLPTGNLKDRLVANDGRALEVTILDVSGLVCFARAEDVALAADVAPAEVNGDDARLELLESVRAAAGRLIGGLSAGSPRLLLVAAPRRHRLADGRWLASRDHDLLVRAMSMQRMHHACPFTVLQCAAAAAMIPGSVTAETAGQPGRAAIRIAHPKGVGEAEVEAATGGVSAGVASVTVRRSARRLLDGRFHFDG
jgi:2-methylaconitate isomerase